MQLVADDPVDTRNTDPARFRGLFRLASTFFLASSIASGLPSLGNLLFAVAAGLTVLAVLARRKVDRYIIIPTLYLTLLFVSGLVMDSLPTHPSVAVLLRTLPAFLIGEGRVFLSYLPLLLPGVCRPDGDDLDFLVRRYRQVAAIGVVLAVVGKLPATGDLIYRGHADLLFGLSSSHHVTGFLFGTTALILLTSSRGSRRANVYLGVASLVLVVLTGSRTSIVGLAVAGFVALFIRSSTAPSSKAMRTFRALVAVGLVLFLPLQSTLKLPIFDAETISAGVASLGERDDSLLENAEDEKTANTLNRFLYWADGIDAFVTSPLVGNGAFRFNDGELTETKQRGVSGLVLVTTEAKRDHGVRTAHNSYLHTAAELGLLGLGLLLAVWIGLGMRLNQQRRSPRAGPDVRSDASAAMLLVAFALGTGLTSSSLFTPGLCIPVLVYLGAVALRRDVEPDDGDAADGDVADHPVDPATLPAGDAR